MKIWRVYNGFTAFGAVHRVVVADTGDEAVAKALAAGMDKGRMTAELVELSTTGAEKTDYE